MMVCVIGGDGNMGSRYRAILDYLDVRYLSVDKSERIPGPDDGVSHYIVATPTKTHAKVLEQIPGNRGRPVSILCEKPIMITDGIGALDAIRFLVENGRRLYMVNQYAYYSGQLPQSSGLTCYDYYNSGGDGIAWDCIQLIHLARGEVTTLSSRSPVWRCVINGTELKRESIDLCYIRMIRDFITDGREYGRLWGWDDIRESHEKVIRFCQDTDRRSGEKR